MVFALTSSNEIVGPNACRYNLESTDMSAVIVAPVSWRRHLLEHPFVQIHTGNSAHDAMQPPIRNDTCAFILKGTVISQTDALIELSCGGMMCRFERKTASSNADTPCETLGRPLSQLIFSSDEHDSILGRVLFLSLQPADEC